MVCVNSPYQFNFFKGWLPQILLSSFLDTLPHINLRQLFSIHLPFTNCWHRLWARYLLSSFLFFSISFRLYWWEGRLQNPIKCLTYWKLLQLISNKHKHCEKIKRLTEMSLFILEIRNANFARYSLYTCCFSVSFSTNFFLIWTELKVPFLLKHHWNNGGNKV